MRADVYSESAAAPGVDVAQASAELCRRQSSISEDAAIWGGRAAGELRKRAVQHAGWRAVLQGMADAVSGSFVLLNCCTAKPPEIHGVEHSRERLQLCPDDSVGIEERPVTGDGPPPYVEINDAEPSGQRPQPRLDDPVEVEERPVEGDGPPPHAEIHDVEPSRQRPQLPLDLCGMEESSALGDGPFALLSRCMAEPDETHDAELSRQRLRLRLDLFGIEERPIQGDGNCQFASVSDQLYGTPRHHPTIRATVVQRLKSEPERYSPYVQGASFEDYLQDVAASGTWGDHVTLQALADALGLRLVLVTSFAQDCIVEILPCKQKSGRVLWLSFLAEVHYSSLYPKGEAPADEKTSCTVS